MIYEFSRIIMKKEAINQYGKLGFREHRESVFLTASSLESARELIKPYNYKKHIKFRYRGTVKSSLFGTDKIVDLGVAEDFNA